MKTTATILAVLVLLQTPASAQAGDSPKAFLEKAAFAAEHERDFEGALALYRKAAELARTMGDAAIAEEAAKAIRKIEDRGKAEVHPVQEGPADRATKARIFDVLDSGQRRFRVKSTDPVDDLSIFGDLAIPMLERLLRRDVVWKEASSDPDSKKIGPASDYAAVVLARMRSPAAFAALKRGLASKDPMTRLEVAQVLDGERHRDLILAALKDLVPNARDAAISRLPATETALVPLIQGFVLEGSDAATQWLMTADSLAGLKLVNDPRATPDLRLKILQHFRFPREMTSEEAQQVVRILGTLLESHPDAPTEDAVLQKVTQTNFGNDNVISKGVFPAAFVECALRRFEIRSKDTQRFLLQNPFVPLLSKSGSLDSVERLLRGYAALPDDWKNNVTQIVNAIRKRSGPSDFHRVLGLTRLLGPGEASGLDLMAWASEIAQSGVPPADVLKGREEIVPEWREEYDLICLLRVPAQAEFAPAYREVLKPGKNWRERYFTYWKVKALGDVSFLPDIVQEFTLLPSAPHKVIEIDPSQDARAQLLTSLQGALRQLALKDPEAATRLIVKAIPDYCRALDANRPGLNLTTILEVPAASVARRLPEIWEACLDHPKRMDLYRYVASALCAKAPPPEALDFLVRKHAEVAHDSPSTMAALAAFARALHEPAIELIGACLQSTSEEVRKAARAALQAFKEHREAKAEYDAWTKGDHEARATIAELLKLLESTDRGVVLGAVRGLGALKARSALPALVKLLAKGDADLSEAVNAAIARMGG